MTIRVRLTLLYSSLLMAIITVFGIAVFGIMDRTLRMQVDHNLHRALDDIEPEVLAIFNERGELVYSPVLWQLDTFRSPGMYVQLMLPDHEYPHNLTQSLGTYHAPLDSATIQADSETYSSVIINRTSLRIITRPLIINSEVVGVLQAASSLETIEAATERLLRILLVGSLVALIFSVVLGNWLASRALSPISKITDTAQAIVAAEDLSRRIDDEGTQDELGSLITTINRMLERLENLFHTQRRFVADISHELRTPATAIQGHVELMQRVGHDPESLHAITKESGRMSQLVNDLLLLAQADAGRLALAIAPVELDALLLKMFGVAQELSEGSVRVTLAAMCPVIVEADEERLKQLLRQLIVNGLKYTPAGGKLTLSMRHEPNYVEISVSDTGSGIPEDHLPYIFDRFYRVDKARSRHGGGSGLGLSIAMWIAEAHGGTLTVNSQKGEGSTFVLRLPLQHFQAEQSTSL